VLAKRWKCTFVDTDALFKKTIGLTVGDYIREYGEPKFRETELGVLRSALDSYDIVSTGGGIISTPEAREVLKSNVTFWLDCDDAVIVERTATGDRPLLGDNPAQGIIALREKREDLYREVARARIDASGKLVQVLNRLTKEYKKVSQ